MAYIGQPVPSTVIKISQLKVSDGKSIDVTVPAGKGVTAGNFYVLDGFFGAVVETVDKDKNTAGKTVSLTLENCEYVTDQIDTKQAFTKGAVLLFDTEKNLFVTTKTTATIPVGRVSAEKDTANTIQFIRAPQMQSASA